MGEGKWPAPAKINLFLHVLGRRADGYHDLQTLFQFLDLSDEIAFSANREGRVRRIGEDPGWPDERDLAVRAARVLRETAGVRRGVDIAITRRIPAGSGLGGGSSDAATTLVALDRLWDLGIGIERLAELGRRLGADVPVFVRGRAAWAEGVGDRLHPVVLEEPRYALVVPPCRVSTAEIFSAYALKPPRSSLTVHRTPLKMADFVSDGWSAVARGPSIQSLLERSVNDCEAVTRKRYPQVDGAIERLARFGKPRMTGTGGAVFVPLADEDAEEGERLLSRLPAGWRGFVCRGLNRSPLIARAGGE